MPGSVDEVAKDLSNPPSQDFFAYAKDQGLDKGVEPQTVKFPAEPVPASQQIGNDTFEKRQQEMAQTRTNDGGGTQVLGEVQNAVKGVEKAGGHIAQNLWNSGIDAANHMSDFANGTGQSKEDLIDKSNKVDWKQFDPSSSDPTITRLFQGITQYAAPVAAATALGAPAAVAVAAEAGVSFGVLDPHQDRLSNLIQEKFPEVKNMAVLGNVVNYLADHHNESDLEGRFKNAVEGALTVGAGQLASKSVKSVVGMFRSTQKVSQLAQRFLNKKVPLPADAAASMEAGTTQVLEQPPHYPPIKSNAELEAGEAQMGSNGADTFTHPSAPEGSLFSNGPTLKARNGTVLPNVNHSDFMAAASQVFKKVTGSLSYVPRNKASTTAELAELLKDPAATITRLAENVAKDVPLTGAETQFVRHLLPMAADATFETIARASAEGTPEAMASALNALDNINALRAMDAKSGSITGANHNMQKMGKTFIEGQRLSDVRKAEDRLVKAKLAGMVRAKMADEIVNANGGQEQVKNLMDKLNEIQKLSPDAAAAKLFKMQKAAGTSSQKFKDTATFYFINSMLSSLKTFTKASFSNAIAQPVASMDRAMAAMIPESLGGGGYQAKDAGNFVRGQMDALMEHVTTVGRGLRLTDQEASTVAKYNVNFVGMNPVSADAYGINKGTMLAKIVDTTGQVMGAPGKLVGMHDSIFGQIAYRGKLNELAYKAAEDAGTPGHAELISKFMEDPPIEAHEAAVQAAQESTMMAPFANNKLGRAGAHLNEFFQDKVPLGGVMQPFMKVGFNLVDYTYQHSPMKGLAAVVSPSIRASLGKPGTAEYALAMGKIMNGSLMLGGATYMAHMGFITGPEVKNEASRQALEESNKGWQPNSVKVGDSYFSINAIEPFASYAKLGAILAHVSNYTTKSEYEQLVTTASGLVAETMLPERLVEANTNLYEAVNGIMHPESRGHATRQLIAGLTSPIIPNIVRDVRNLTDTSRADTEPGGSHGALTLGVDKIYNSVKNRVPEWNESLPIDRNIFAEPLLVPSATPKADVNSWVDRAMSMVSPFATSHGKNSPEDEALKFLAGYYEEHKPLNHDLNQLQVSKPSRIFSMNKGSVKIPLNPKEYERLVMYTAGKNPDTGADINEGQNLRTLTQQTVLPFYEKLKNGTISPMEYNIAVGKLSKMFNDVKQHGKQLMAQDPAFNAKVQQQLKNSATKQVNVFD